MDWDLQSIFTFPPLKADTINTVFLSPAFRTVIYVLIAFTSIIAATVLIAQKHHFTVAFKKAIVTTFFVSGLVYAVYSEVGWTKWLIHDYQTYSGLKTDEKLMRMHGYYYAFVQRVRNVIDDDYILYSSDENMSLRTEYFLLPRRKRDQAKFIIVMEDQEARFDLTTRSFMRGDVKISPVEPVLIYSQGAYYVLKRNP